MLGCFFSCNSVLFFFYFTPQGHHRSWPLRSLQTSSAIELVCPIQQGFCYCILSPPSKLKHCKHPSSPWEITMGGLALLWGSPIEAMCPSNPWLKSIPDKIITSLHDISQELNIERDTKHFIQNIQSWYICFCDNCRFCWFSVWESEARRHRGISLALHTWTKCIWSAAPCVASHQQKNIKAVLHVKCAHLSHKLSSLAVAQQGGALTWRQAASSGQQGDINHSFWCWRTDVSGDQKGGYHMENDRGRSRRRFWRGKHVGLKVERHEK